MKKWRGGSFKWRGGSFVRHLNADGGGAAGGVWVLFVGKLVQRPFPSPLPARSVPRQTSRLEKTLP